MGGHYGSIHIRTEDTNVVRTALSELARDHGKKFLVAPLIDGWITAFPSENGQDFRVSALLAQKINSPFLHCLVHDDDVFAYHFYEDGMLAGEYNSGPDYFGGEAGPKGGDVSILRSVLPDKEKQAALRKLLDAERFDFEMERLDQFATILGLPNAVSAYEYLQDGERDGIKQWKGFTHVPDLTAERVAKRAAKSKAKAAMKQLAHDGILITELIGSKTDHSLFHQSPVWTINPKTHEVLLLWTGNPMGAPKPVPVFRIDSRTGFQQATNLNSSDHTSILAIDPSGRWLAAGCASGEWEAQVWDMDNGRRVTDLPQSRAVNGLCFSRDGQTLFNLSEQTITLASGTDLKAIETIQLKEHGRSMALHPQGKYMVVNSQGMLTIVHVLGRTELKTVWIDARPSFQRTLLEQVAPQAAARFLDVLSSSISAPELENQRMRMQRHFLPKQGVFCMTFSSDGELLICGTNEGVCVFDWRAVLAAEDMSPLVPRIFVEAEAPVPEDKESATGHKLIYSVIYDSTRLRVLFAGLEGKVRFLELVDGLTGDLLVPPIRLPFWLLELVPNRTALVGTATKLGTRKPEPQKFQIWNYPALCKAAGIPF